MRRLMISAALLVASMAAAPGQDASSAAVSYCAELKQVTALALGRDRFASIAGPAREGNFRDTSLALTGWKDCSLYGAGAYTCDSQGFGTAEEAQTAQSTIVRDVLACLGTAWAEIRDRSSPGYVVLHPLRGAVSITLSLDENNDKQHVVRFTLFIRR